MEPEVVDGNTFAFFACVCPLAPMLVLGILPLRSDTFFEKVVVGFDWKFGRWGDVVLKSG